MSTVKTTNITHGSNSGTANIVLASDGSVTFGGSTTGSYTGRNVAYNGAMQIAQRGTSFASVTTSGTYPVDRFCFHVGSCGTWTVSQDTDVPTGQGFVKSLKCDVTTADTNVGSGGYCRIDHRLEGQDLHRFRKGTGNAKDFALSFWVKSTKTGTHIIELMDHDNSRSISKAYTVSSSNTWEKKELTISKDTSGAFDNDNAKSLTVAWWLAAGSNYTSGTLETSWVSTVTADRVVGQVSCVDNTSNNFYITGVQLETTACTDFEHKSHGEDLARCQRYYQLLSDPGQTGDVIAVGFMSSSTSIYGHRYFPVTMRSTPTMDDQTSGGTRFRCNGAGTDSNSGNAITLDSTISSPQGAFINGTGFSGHSTGGGASLRKNSATERVGVDAELS